MKGFNDVTLLHSSSFLGLLGATVFQAYSADCTTTQGLGENPSGLSVLTNPFRSGILFSPCQTLVFSGNFLQE
jgi:hypothetical protein